MRQRLGHLGLLFLLAWVVISTCGPPLRAQEGDAPAAKKPADNDVLPFELLPKVYVLKDKEGNLQAMPGIGFEEFIETWKARHQLGPANPRPSYSIESLSISGNGARERAELVARFSIAVLEAGWVGVPLRLAGAVVREPTYDGPGEHVLRYDAERDGYVVWIKGEAGKSHQVTLKFVARVLQAGPESRLRLNVPRAAVSQMQLQVPVERAIAQVSEGATLESTRAIEGGRTQLNVIGVGGEFEIGWHAAEVQVAALPSVLEATGALFVRVNGRSANTEAKLVVRSLSGQFDRFEVRLPPGADYVGTAPPGMTLAAVDTNAVKGKLYAVQLDAKTSGPVEVPLVTERIHNSPQADELLELAGFEVVGAVRQSGTIAVKIEGNWQVLWGDANHVTRVDDVGNVPRRDEATAGFEYFAQPCSLTARVVPQQTRVRAQGEYVLLVGGEQAQLSGKLKYTIRGAKVRSLELELPGWEVDSVGPANLVNVDAALSENNGVVTIPLVEATSGELELTLEAHQKVAPEQGNVSLTLPRPRGETIAPANVAVVPADNIDLEFKADESVALAPQSVRPPITLPERLQDPLFFRTEAAEAKFVGAIKVHDQSITVTASTQLEVDEPEIKVDARLAFRIAYEPADHLMLGVPRSIRADRLAVTLDGQRLAAAPTRERPGETGDVVPMRVALPSARIGRCELQIRYTVRHDRAPGAAQTRVIVPLVIPGEGQVTANELVVVPRAGITASYPSGPWSEDAQGQAAASEGALTLAARRALSDVTLALSYKDRPTAGATTIKRAWIQTRLTDSQRMDRAVYRLTTAEPRLQLTLPPGADMRLVELEIDARAVTPDSIRQRDVIVSVPDAVGGEHVLELRYRFAERQPYGQLELTAAQIDSADWIDQLYWQLVIPAHEHVLSSPVGLAREFRWVWTNVFWQREPSWEQRELESWCGVAPASEVARGADETAEKFAARQRAITNATNRYLYSGVGAVGPLRIYTLPRARLVLWASLPLLLLGLALIYFPRVRHPALVFALAVLIAAGSLIDPESAVLVAQASSLGWVLAALAVLLASSSKRPADSSVPVRGSSKAIVERGVTEIYQRAATSSSQQSTATDPLISAAAPEGES